MFGHQDSTNQNTVVQQPTAPSAPSADGILNHPIAPQTSAPTASAPLADDSNTSDGNEYIVSDLPAPQPAQPVISDTLADTLTEPPALPATDNTTGLLELKQAALHELSPLLDHLDQTAEERFRTMMMMIQASDDQTLLAEAYEAAHSIEDKKARAQALLDIINEINYFTQPQGESNVS